MCYFVLGLRSMFISPFFFFLGIIIPAIRRRLALEKASFNDDLRRSHGESTYLFEVSSEGELEQALPLMIKFMEDNCLVELLYCSDSVALKVEKLCQKYPQNLKAMALPLLRYSFFNGGPFKNIARWSHAKTVVLCRYDFFPELMMLGHQSSRRFILISASLKSKYLTIKKSWWSRLWWKTTYSFFDGIVAENQLEENHIVELFNTSSIKNYTLRVPRIKERGEFSKETIQKLIGEKFFSFLTDEEKKSSVVFAQFWPYEASLMTEEFVQGVKSGDFRFFLAPHKLSEESIIEVTKILTEKFYIDPYVIKKGVTANELEIFVRDFSKMPKPVLITVPGVLCELYQYMDHVFVGGGHGRSVHSLLEPYLAGSFVYCGPKVYRSSEFDYIRLRNEDNPVIIEKMTDFFPLLSEKLHFSQEKSHFNEEKESCEFEEIVNFVRADK
jgi:3-deoxy-D-manno-octulosonic-acid transferase